MLEFGFTTEVKLEGLAICLSILSAKVDKGHFAVAIASFTGTWS